MTEKPVRDYDKFMLRFPDGMRDIIAERAKSNGRSMNSEIVQILQDVIEGEQKSDYQSSYNAFFNILHDKKFSHDFYKNMYKIIDESVKENIDSWIKIIIKFNLIENKDTDIKKILTELQDRKSKQKKSDSDE
ncbi:Arc family DNA-binding protein [Salmonella enterica]|nr:Arc family DNA-binding protein [Salmonella enterica]EJA5147268.1 Arc family DNA-binding protein [Salmonella enterica]EJX3843112.1 Arc family DNA-binding protein [Salmonella enterica]EJX4247717.1 Arc family DNA-binding protein [Salmonella enterica]EJX4290203.1 Arc family DNA-binding protein [Salmonella enterica]